jgi:hypothetical protein
MSRGLNTFPKHYMYWMVSLLTNIWASDSCLLKSILKSQADVYSKHAQTNWQVSLRTFSIVTKSLIPTFFKQTAIVPVPKKAKVTCLKDYRPIAFTLVAMRCFQRLVMV